MTYSLTELKILTRLQPKKLKMRTHTFNLHVGFEPAWQIIVQYDRLGWAKANFILFYFLVEGLRSSCGIDSKYELEPFILEMSPQMQL